MELWIEISIMTKVLDVQNFLNVFVRSLLLWNLVHTALFAKVHGLNQSTVGHKASP